MFGVNFDVCRVRNGLPLMFKGSTLMSKGTFWCLWCRFRCPLTRCVCLNTRATLRGFEDLQQERVADLSSPAPWNCGADAFQSCIIAETVAKEPVARAFSWKCWRKSQKKYSRAKRIPVVYQPCANVLLISNSLHKTKTIYSAFFFFFCCVVQPHCSPFAVIDIQGAALFFFWANLYCPSK